MATAIGPTTVLPPQQQQRSPSPPQPSRLAVWHLLDVAFTQHRGVNTRDNIRELLAQLFALMGVEKTRLTPWETIRPLDAELRQIWSRDPMVAATFNLNDMPALANTISIAVTQSSPSYNLAFESAPNLFAADQALELVPVGGEGACLPRAMAVSVLSHFLHLEYAPYARDVVLQTIIPCDSNMTQYETFHEAIASVLAMWFKFFGYLNWLDTADISSFVSAKTPIRYRVRWDAIDILPSFELIDPSKVDWPDRVILSANCLSPTVWKSNKVIKGIYLPTPAAVVTRLIYLLYRQPNLKNVALGKIGEIIHASGLGCPPWFLLETSASAPFYLSNFEQQITLSEMINVCYYNEEVWLAGFSAILRDQVPWDAIVVVQRAQSALDQAGVHFRNYLLDHLSTIDSLFVVTFQYNTEAALLQQGGLPPYHVLQSRFDARRCIILVHRPGHYDTMLPIHAIYDGKENRTMVRNYVAPTSVFAFLNWPARHPHRLLDTFDVQNVRQPLPVFGDYLATSMEGRHGSIVLEKYRQVGVWGFPIHSIRMVSRFFSTLHPTHIFEYLWLSYLLYSWQSTPGTLPKTLWDALDDRDLWIRYTITHIYPESPPASSSTSFDVIPPTASSEVIHLLGTWYDCLALPTWLVFSLYVFRGGTWLYSPDNPSAVATSNAQQLLDWYRNVWANPVMPDESVYYEALQRANRRLDALATEQWAATQQQVVTLQHLVSELVTNHLLQYGADPVRG